MNLKKKVLKGAPKVSKNKSRDAFRIKQSLPLNCKTMYLCQQSESQQYSQKPAIN